MDAIIGRYRAHIEENGLLVLKHPSGICFDLTAEETLGLLDFMSVYRKALLELERETDPALKRIVIHEEEQAVNREGL